jgi:hypothetical protein
MAQLRGWRVCVQTPAWQVSVVHERPSSAHAPPVGVLVHDVVLVPGTHVWQALAGFAAPDA